MKREIGSEFWDIPVCDRENELFPASVKWFLSGRIALKYIILDAGIRSVSMPEWCCDSMIAPFLENGVTVRFYNDVPSTDADALFIMDYFGFTAQTQVPAGYRGTVIRDMTHSVFSKKYDDADYYFGSLRKWAGFKTGGFAYGSWKKSLEVAECDEKYISLRTTAMREKKAYISGATDDKSYLDVFRSANERLKQVGICAGYEEDIYAARHLDIDFIKEKRRENAKVLMDRIGCMFPLKENDCPLFVPIITEDRDALQNFFIDHKIYCPAHWPRNSLKDRELSLICDQRYDKVDMERICRLIADFREGKK